MDMLANGISLNERAYTVVRKMVNEAQALRVEVSRLPNGTHVIDAGVHAEGTLEVGRMVSEVCLAGLGTVRMTPWAHGDLWLPGVSVEVSQPVLGCLASQLAGWPVQIGDFFGMGSGPARAIAAHDEVFEKVGYRDVDATVAVLFFETNRLPDAKVADEVAKGCGIDPENLWLIAAPTESTVGSIQIAARIVETGMHKLLELGFDVNTVVSGYGVCPVAPLVQDPLVALGRVNDCIMYGGTVFLYARGSDEAIREIIHLVPSSGSRDYGRPFLELFEASGRDFYKMDRLLFSPARMVINHIPSGKTYCAGEIDTGILKNSIGWGYSD